MRDDDSTRYAVDAESEAAEAWKEIIDAEWGRSGEESR
jgi:hypothetical protein